MGAGPDWVELGLPGLFAASFLAATLLPFSSEALLATMAQGPWPWVALWAVATVGNTLGGLLTYVLGRLGRTLSWRGLGVASADASPRWLDRVRRWGPWAALLSWLPVVGDLIAVALGTVGCPWPATALLMGVGKALRYAALLAAMGAAS